jgi:hypothetical protein
MRFRMIGRCLSAVVKGRCPLRANRNLKASYKSFSGCLFFHSPSMHPPGDDNPAPLLYQWQEGVEDLETYYVGGYHPTHLGDRYHDGRYEVVHKLGFGSYSTVWLARDHLHNSFAALKIGVASAFQESTESEVLRVLASGNQEHPGRPYVISLLDEFVIAGPNGRHHCIVSEPMGCSAANSKDETMPWKFPLVGARSIAAQVLLGLDYIRSCNIVHGGKLHPDSWRRNC